MLFHRLSSILVAVALPSCVAAASVAESQIALGDRDEMFWMRQLETLQALQVLAAADDDDGNCDDDCIETLFRQMEEAAGIATNSKWLEDDEEDEEEEVEDEDEDEDEHEDDFTRTLQGGGCRFRCKDVDDIFNTGCRTACKKSLECKETCKEKHGKKKKRKRRCSNSCIEKAEIAVAEKLFSTLLLPGEYTLNVKVVGTISKSGKRGINVKAPELGGAGSLVVTGLTWSGSPKGYVEFPSAGKKYPLLFKNVERKIRDLTVKGEEYFVVDAMANIPQFGGIICFKMSPTAFDRQYKGVVYECE